MDDAIAELGTGGQPILNPVPRQNSGGVMKNHLHKKRYTPIQCISALLIKVFQLPVKIRKSHPSCTNAFHACFCCKSFRHPCFPCSGRPPYHEVALVVDKVQFLKFSDIVQIQLPVFPYDKVREKGLCSSCIPIVLLWHLCLPPVCQAGASSDSLTSDHLQIVFAFRLKLF